MSADDCRAEAARRLAAVRGDGALALEEACREVEGLRAALHRSEDHSKVLLRDAVAPNGEWWQSEAEQATASAAAAHARATAAEARAEALLGYTQHTLACETAGVFRGRCTCGLDNLRGGR